jgi:DNA-binding transcriptional MerR regulator
MKRAITPLSSLPQGSAGAGAHFSEAELTDLEAKHADGLSTQQVVELFAARGERLSEATFRKYVQLGLLPRSVRVGRKGKHRGSQGLYPATVVRQIEVIRALMAQGHTIQDIQREFIGLRGDIDALGRQLAQILSALESAVRGGEPAHVDEVVGRALGDARQMANQLVEKLRAIEARLAMRARMARAAV